ncbi:MAG TPA: Crp/Fnr family transcriptional regulator [Caulobacteraceae bacterium]|nr:Crp/Fnr family transcriptional regulator [Caulobacteraceae bacterium]
MTGQARIRIRALPQLSRDDSPFLVLTPKENAELARLAEVLEFEKGTTVTVHGQPANFLFLVAEGVAESDRILPDGSRQVVAFYWPGDVCGLAANGLYMNSAHTLTRCKFYRFKSEIIGNVFAANGIEYSFLLKAIHDLRSAQRQVVAMGRLGVTRRLAAFLADCADHETGFDQKQQVLTLPMTRQDIADHIGASTEVVTRAFSELQANGLLRRLTPRQLWLSPARMKVFAGLGDDLEPAAGE